MQDLECIRSVLAGRTEDYSILVNKYMNGVFRIALGFVHEKSDADDICQEVFVKAWQGLPDFDQRAAFPTWLYRITINESLNYLNRKKRRKFRESLSSFFGGDPVSKDPGSDLDQKEEYLSVRRILDSLSPKQKQAFVLSEYQDMSQREIAQVMELSEGAVEQLLYRARQHLRKKMEKIKDTP